MSLPVGWAYSSKQQHGLHAPIIGAQLLGMGMRIWQHKEIVSIDHMQQIYLNQMEGKTAPIHRKGKVSVEQERTPYNMTCNYLPWLPIQDLEIRKAFHNRCFFFMT